MKRLCWFLILSAWVAAPALQAQVPPTVACRNLQLAAGERAPLPCTIRGGDDIGYTYRWASANVRHLRLLSSPAVLSPLFSAPAEVASPLQVAYTLVVETVKGQPLGRASLQVEVRPAFALRGGAEGKAPIFAHGPPEVHCPPTLFLYERETETLACQATDPATGTGASLHYVWHAGGEPLTVSPLEVPNPTVVAPPLANGEGSRSFPLTLTVTSRRSQRTAHAQVTVVVRARDPSLHCPTDIEVEAGASVVLACQGTDPLRGAATYQWTGLWGSSTAPLRATDGVAPTFVAPYVSRDTTFHYVVRMQSQARSTRHKVTVHVRGASPKSDAPSCEDLTIFERERRPLPCRLPGGHHLRWRGPTGPGAPFLTQQALTAPPVTDDTAFTYYVEACPNSGGACTPGPPWIVTVQRRKPPAVSCKTAYDTYAGEADLLLHCATSGGTAHTYVWTGPDTDRLSATDVLTPTFDVPSQLAEDRRYAYTLTVTDAIIGSASTDVAVLVRKRGAIALDCSRREYSVYAGSADFLLQPQCALSGAPDPAAGYYHRWYARSAARDAARLSATHVRHPLFVVPDTLVAPYTYQYTYAVGARYADPASVEVRVTVAPFPAAFDVSVSMAAVQFGDQAAGGQVTLDPLTGNLSTKVRGSHNVGRMILAADKDVDADVQLSGGMLYHQDAEAVLPLAPQWAVSTSCLGPAFEVLASDYATVALRAQEGGCRVLNFGGALDLRHAAPGHYAGNLDAILRTGEVQETFLVPVFVTVVPPRRIVTAGPQGTTVGPEGMQRVTEVQQVRIHPLRALLTPEQPYGTFTLSNPSVITQEISVQPVFGYAEARTDRAGEAVVRAPTEAVGDLGAALVVYPKVFTLSPGETQYVHYALREDIELPKGAYATFLDFSSRPRRYVRADRLPTPDDSARVAHVTLRIQGAYIPGQGTRHVAATRLPDAPDLILLEATDGPFEGTVVATDADGNELGRRNLLLLTTRIVQWPLEPPPEGEVRLHFITEHGDAPPPVTLR